MPGVRWSITTIRIPRTVAANVSSLMRRGKRSPESAPRVRSVLYKNSRQRWTVGYQVQSGTRRPSFFFTENFLVTLTWFHHHDPLVNRSPPSAPPPMTPCTDRGERGGGGRLAGATASPKWGSLGLSLLQRSPRVYIGSPPPSHPISLRDLSSTVFGRGGPSEYSSAADVPRCCLSRCFESHSQPTWKQAVPRGRHCDRLSAPSPLFPSSGLRLVSCSPNSQPSPTDVCCHS